MALSKNDGEYAFFAGYSPKGYQQITSLAAAVGLTVPANSTFALLASETQEVRWRDDGTNPTTTVGMKLPVDSYFFYTGNLATIKFIEITASAKLNVTYY